MSVNDIYFPGLDILFKNVPKSFQVFGVEIAYYGVVIGIGAMLGFLLALKIAKLEKQDPELYWDFIIYALIFSVIGARVYYVIFSFDSYNGNIWEMINIRNGGLAIYGGVIGGFLTCFVYCKIKKKNPLDILDVGVYGLLVGQIIGRYANFFNRETFGDYCSNMFRMLLPVDAVRHNEITDALAKHIVEYDGVSFISVHPTFLYESMWNVLVLIFLLFYRKHKKFKGELALIYLGGYGLGRFFIEQLRTDQLLLWKTNIAVSELLGICLFIFAVVTDTLVRARMKRKEVPQRKESQQTAAQTEETIVEEKQN